MPTAQQEVEIVNRLGLHARAAAKFAAVASEYGAEITVRRGDREVNGKSIMGLMMLAAARGASITIVCNGHDADAALNRLTGLVAGRFEEEE
ncbi:HPr family phosphocarrier protein [Ectothiorhodospiraceae bacterium WFHF3C12]|nr:HPr family phosphocarrier protein [Ectothiorhodospiraceae bacterium WFHF3C12]